MFDSTRKTWGLDHKPPSLTRPRSFRNLQSSLLQEQRGGPVGALTHQGLCGLHGWLGAHFLSFIPSRVWWNIVVHRYMMTARIDTMKKRVGEE
uniref:Uncharacterized protein n=1 Tax=Timema monikensis TaxID=170555 RepID=A0A7R9EJB6_9NEOP|nr:unnamed protein product [Timema monikensis]